MEPIPGNWSPSHFVATAFSLDPAAVNVTTIGSFQEFNRIYQMSTGANVGTRPGGPLGATQTLVVLVYNEFYQSLHVGYGAAIAFVLFLILLFLSLIQFGLARRWSSGSGSRTRGARGGLQWFNPGNCRATRAVSLPGGRSPVFRVSVPMDGDDVAETAKRGDSPSAHATSTALGFPELCRGLAVRTVRALLFQHVSRRDLRCSGRAYHGDACRLCICALGFSRSQCAVCPLYLDPHDPL